jgi:hypothetical protein
MRLLRWKGLFPRAGIIGAALAVAGLLGGCTAVRFGYNQGPDLAYWWLDRSFSFNDSQSPAIRDGLGDWFAWHRRTQLPDYAALLAELALQARTDIDADRACRWYGRLSDRGDVALQRAYPFLAAAARDVTSAQIAHVQKQHAKRTAEFKDDYLQADTGERLQASVERAVGRFERIYGRLGETQKAVVARDVQGSPFDASRWMAERERRHQDLVATLRDLQARRPSVEETQRLLKGLAERNRVATDPAYREYQVKLTRYNCEFAARLHNATTAAQREAAAQRLKGWEEDARVLARQAPSSTPASTPTVTTAGTSSRNPTLSP